MPVYSLKSHRLHIDGSPVPYRETPNKYSSVITPEVIVLHDTASRLDMSSVDWLCERKAKASAHFVTGRNGEVVQLAPTDVATWHAGTSSYKGRLDVNGFSLGIEIVNPGRMDVASGGRGARAWFGTVYDRDVYDIEPRSTPEHGSGYWMAYPEAQISAVVEICRAMVTAYPTIKAITTHYIISPGRKVDVNPLFPLDAVRSFVFGAGADPVSADGTDAVTTSGVNWRRWPSLADNVIRVLPKGTRGRVVRSGVFTNTDTARWHLLAVDDGEGWVHGAYVDLD